MLDDVSAELRRLSHELRPSILDNLGLMPAIEFLADGVAKRTGLDIRLYGSTQGRLPHMVETALYRTVQEALTNIRKHARARNVRIQLWTENGSVLCSIRDDGIGADLKKVSNDCRQNRLGLIGIQERVEVLKGTMSITSAPGKGMKVQVAIPVESMSSEDLKFRAGAE